MAIEERPDFSKKAVSRAVLKQTTQHPTVLYPAGAAIIGGIAMAAIGPSIVALGAAIGGGVLALGSWAVNHLARRDSFATAYVAAMRDKMMNEHTEAMGQLKGHLTEVGSETGLAQLRRVKEKFDSFKTVLSSKMEPNELTFGRYLGIAEQVYFSVLDNLARVVSVSRSAAAIDIEYTRARHGQLNAMESRDKAEETEMNTLARRLELANEQGQRIKDWLAMNEEAMTQLDHTAMELAAIETKRGLASLNLETAMAELQRLAASAENYDLNKS